MDTVQKLETIFSDTFIEDNYSFSMDTSMDDIQEWDSLNQVRLLMAVEQEFGIRFELEEMEQLTSVAALVEAISRKTG
ncbi:MAG: acyl carrier protein [Parahaliea sp.]